MGEVHNILEASPHMSGEALCLACNHKWVAVVPCGEYSLQCPACDTYRGVLNANPMNSNIAYTCNCGCSHFGIMPSGRALCLLCGTGHDVEPMPGPRIA